MLDENTILAIEQVIKRGNEAEVKMMYGKVVVVEIHRKTAYKAVTNG